MAATTRPNRGDVRIMSGVVVGATLDYRRRRRVSRPRRGYKLSCGHGEGATYGLPGSKDAAVGPPVSDDPSGSAEALSGSAAAGRCTTVPPLDPLPAPPPLPYPPPARVDTLTAVRFVRPPTALRKTPRTPTRQRASTAISKAYSRIPAPASQVRNRRMSCRTGTPSRSIGNGQRGLRGAAKAVRVKQKPQNVCPAQGPRRRSG